MSSSTSSPSARTAICSPKGTGRLLRAGSKIKFDFHYHSVGKEITDQSQLGIVLYPKGYVPKHIVYSKQLGQPTEPLDIPGGSTYVRSDGYTRFNKAGRITAFQPHMHTRGKRQCIELIYPDNKVEQISCADWSFNWHLVSVYADDVAPIYPAGTVLHVITLARQLAVQGQSRSEELGRQRQPDDRRDGIRLDHLVRLHRRGVQGGARGAQRREENHDQRWTARNEIADCGLRICGLRRCGSRCSRWLAAPLLAQTQSTELHIKFRAGQGVVPIYEGWERVPDGSFNMVFGYLNRNHVQQLAIPVGAQNGFDPGPADRGQPAYFYPRENHFIFRVNVPKDWDRKKELVWTITANGKTETARATLLDIWEIDRKVEVSNNGGGVQISNELIFKDQPPAITIAPVAARPRGHAGRDHGGSVTDDGIPGEQKPRTPRRSRAVAARRAAVAGQRPAADAAASAASAVGAVDGLSRDQTRATFDPEGYVKVADGKVDVKATFSRAGTYTLRAFAHDGLLRTPADVTVTVDGPNSSQ